jgi:hypothetical protein
MCKIGEPEISQDNEPTSGMFFGFLVLWEKHARNQGILISQLKGKMSLN